MVPIARLAYEYIWVDPVTFEPRGDPSWSDALYYTVECQDYGFPTGSHSSRALGPVARLGRRRKD